MNPSIETPADVGASTDFSRARRPIPASAASHESSHRSTHAPTLDAASSTARSPVSPLRFRRIVEAADHPDAAAGEEARAGADRLDPASLLGGRRVGGGHADALAAPLIAPFGRSVFDAWCATAPVREHRVGSVRYATDGTWLHGVAEIDDRDGCEGGLSAAAQRAYADIFGVLARSDMPSLVRLWNYFADITGHEAGTERYRLFNIGRQQAFVEARRSAFEGAPAACALGVRSGPLRVGFLAGHVVPVAIENPRQVSAYRYPDTYGPRSPTFSRAALVDVGDGRRALFVSGTASIVGHTSLHLGDVRRQTEESLLNLATVRRAAEARGTAVFAPGEMVYTLYVRHAGDAALVREVFEREVGAGSLAAREAVYLQADICRPELLVEVEAHGFAVDGGGA